MNMGSSHHLAPLDGGWGWMIMLSASIMMFCINGTDRVQAQTYEVFIQKLSTSKNAMCVWAVGIQISLRYLLAPLGTFLYQKLDVRLVVVMGGLLRTTGIILSIYASKSWHVLLTFGILGGAGAAISFAPTISILRAYFEKRRMLVFTVSTSFMAAGHFIHPLMMQAGLNLYGYTGFLYVWATVALQVCVGGALLRPLEENYTKEYIRMTAEPDSHNMRNTQDYEMIEKSDVGSNGIEKEHIDERTELSHGHTEKYSMSNTDLHGFSKQGTRSASIDLNQSFNTEEFTNSDVRKSFLEHWERTKKWFCTLWPGRCGAAFMIAILMSTLGYYPAVVLVVDMLMERGETMDQVVFMTVILNVFDVISRLLIALMFDKEQFKPYRKRFFMFFPLATSLACLGFALAKNLSWTYFFFALGGIGISNINGMCYVILSDIVTLETYSTMVAVLGVVQGVGHLFGSLTAGLIHDTFNNYEAPLLFSSGVFLFGFIILLLDELKK